MARVIEFKPTSERERAEVQFKKVFGNRTLPERIMQIVKGRKMKIINLAELANESNKHHRTEKQLLELIHRFAIAAEKEGGKVEFPPEMVRVINAYQVRPSKPRFSDFHPSLQGDRKVVELVLSHHRKTLALCKKVEAILGTKGVGGVAKIAKPRRSILRLAA